MMLSALNLTNWLNKVFNVPQKKTEPLDQVFLALADGHRRQLVHLLAEKPRNIGELCEHFAMSMAGVSKHIKVLESAGLVRRRIEGRIHIINLVPERLTGALDWIRIYRYFWDTRLQRLDQLFTEENTHVEPDD